MWLGLAAKGLHVAGLVGLAGLARLAGLAGLAGKFKVPGKVMLNPPIRGPYSTILNAQLTMDNAQCTMHNGQWTTQRTQRCKDTRLQRHIGSRTEANPSQPGGPKGAGG